MILYAKFGKIIPIINLLCRQIVKNIVYVFDTLANISPLKITDTRWIIFEKVELMIYFNSTKIVTITLC